MTARTHSIVLALTGALLLGPSTATSQRAPRDTAALRDTSIADRQLFHRSDLYVAGAFLGGTLALFPLDKHLAQQIRQDDLLNNRNLSRLAGAARFFGGPGPLIIGPSLYLIGRVGRFPHITEIAVHGTEAVLVGAVTAGVIKGLAGRARPYVTNDSNPHSFGFGRGIKSDKYKSFPSGHATAAFSAAAAVTAEMNDWLPGSTPYVATVMYGGATLVGLSRMYDDQHWASDVLMGAAIGTFAGLKTVRFNKTHAGNRLDEILLGVRVTPAPGGGAIGWSASF